MLALFIYSILYHAFTALCCVIGSPAFVYLYRAVAPLHHFLFLLLSSMRDGPVAQMPKASEGLGQAGFLRLYILIVYTMCYPIAAVLELVRHESVLFNECHSGQSRNTCVTWCCIHLRSSGRLNTPSNTFDCLTYNLILFRRFDSTTPEPSSKLTTTTLKEDTRIVIESIRLSYTSFKHSSTLHSANG